jgi:AraC-like DNA-binding protein
MRGIDLDRPITYKQASLRFFDEGEHHVERLSRDDVLLLVYEGVLRFSEDGIETEVHAGEYYIQEKNRYQAGKRASDAPKYLYVHFDGVCADAPHALPPKGFFPTHLLDRMRALDAAYHGGNTYIDQLHLFLEILLALCPAQAKDPTAEKIAAYMQEHLEAPFSLETLSEAFHYSENYMIRIFKRAYGLTPIAYLNNARLCRASELLEQTSRSATEIAAAVGYSDYAYFYRLFAKKTGVSPTVFRKQLRGDDGFQR